MFGRLFRVKGTLHLWPDIVCASMALCWVTASRAWLVRERVVSSWRIKITDCVGEAVTRGGIHTTDKKRQEKTLGGTLDTLGFGITEPDTWLKLMGLMLSEQGIDHDLSLSLDMFMLLR